MFGHLAHPLISPLAAKKLLTQTKSYLQSSISDTRMNGLALFSIYGNNTPFLEQIVNR